jgi:uncharacterized protein
MKLHPARGEAPLAFTGYGEGYVAVNQQRYDHHVLVTPGGAVERWNVGEFEDLKRADFDALLALGAEIVLFGSGARLRFPPRQLTAGLAASQVGFEAMDTRAACRTYNILVAEGRKVLAVILVEPPGAGR